MVFLPLRGHTVQKVLMTMPATRLEKLGVFLLKSHSCSHTSATTWRSISFNRKWPCIPRYVQCQGQLFSSEIVIPISLRSSSLFSPPLFFLLFPSDTCGRGTHVQRVKSLDRSSGSRNVSRVACAFDERGNENGKGRSRTINVCHVSRVFDITKRKLLGYFDTGQRNRRRNERRFYK